MAIVCAASLTAASLGPHPESIAFLVALTNSIILAITTLNLNDSTANSISASVLWVTFRSSKLPVLKSISTLLLTS